MERSSSYMTNAFVNYGRTELDSMERYFKKNFVSSLPGYKGVNLIGTINHLARPNLAIFNTVFHVGSNPPLLGMLCRSPLVSSHTLNNIRETGFYTINHIKSQFFTRAHQTAADYEKDISEFEVVGLNHVYTDQLPAPYVKESPVQIGMKLKEEITLRSNGTVLLIGEVIEVILPVKSILSDGLIDLGITETITCSGRDTYYTTNKIARLSMPSPDKDLDIIG
jgi:flavin reductase (DIM6/NTAB) family NADH-FMN oxidoreductase RutF